MRVRCYQIEIDTTVALSITYDPGARPELAITSGTVNGVALRPDVLRAIMDGCADELQQGTDPGLEHELAGQHDDDGPQHV